MNPEPPALSVPPPVDTLPAEEQTPEAPRPWGFWLTVAFGLCIFGSYVIAQSLVVIVAALVGGNIANPKAVEALASNGLVISICMVVGVPFIVGFSVLFAWLRRGVPVSEYLGFTRASWKSIVLGLVSVVALGFAYDWISTAMGRHEVPEFMLKAYSTAGFTPLLWVAVIIGAPLAEEIFFRGFLFKGFERSPIGGVGTVILTSLSWALIHLQYDPYDIFSIFLLGLLLGTVRLKTGSLVPALLMHMLQNLLATIQVAFLVAEQ